MYYALGHISRFLTPGSVRIGLDKPKDPFIEAVAVKLPFQDNPNLINDSIAVVILNRLVCITITLHMCDFHNFGLIFTGQCTVCLKG